jgi:hypothetical protein
MDGACARMPATCGNQHNDARFDWYFELRDSGDGFRADDGFVPQVGFRE